MKKLLLLLLLIPIYSIGQVTISSNNYNVSVKLDSIIVKDFRVRIYNLNGKLLRDYTSLFCNKYTTKVVESIVNDYITCDARPTKVTTFKFNDVAESVGTYIIIIQYNDETLRKLIYISN